MKINTVFIAAIVLLLLVVNWLTFHDLFEPHTLRDWLILFASSLIFLFFAKSLVKKSI